MPELPEVETVCEGLRPVCEGSIIKSVKQRRPNLRFPFPENMVERLKSQRINHLSRRAKYILCHLDNHEILVLHLGMSGQLLIQDTNPAPSPQKHDHMTIVLNNQQQITLRDPRRFGLVDLISNNEIHTHKLFSHLGPEPLEEEFNPEYLYQALLKRKAPVKNLIMDQKIVVGVGNIYACEALFKSRISPQRPGNNITETEASQLYSDIKEILEQAIKSGGSSLKDYVQASGELGYFQHKWAVYNKAGQNCPECKGQIERIKQAGRSSFYCPNCQK